MHTQHEPTMGGNVWERLAFGEVELWPLTRPRIAQKMLRVVWHAAEKKLGGNCGTFRIFSLSTILESDLSLECPRPSFLHFNSLPLRKASSTDSRSNVAANRISIARLGRKGLQGRVYFGTIVGLWCVIAILKVCFGTSLIICRICRYC